MLWMMGYDYDQELLELDKVAHLDYDSESDNYSTNSDTSIYENNYSDDEFANAIDIA